MVFLDALKQHGLTNERLKKIFTAEPEETIKKPTKKKKANGGAPTESDWRTSGFSLEKLPENPTDWDVRCFLETVIEGEIQEGQQRCLKQFNRVGAVDLAYAGMPINPILPDLLKVAMGYVSMADCAASLAGLSQETKDRLFEKDAKGNVTSINTPKLFPVAHNLVHSLTTRRVAALSTEVNNQFPLLKYEPYSNTQTGRLGGDVMTQLAEQMAGGYGYRNDYKESILHASLYTNCIKFKSSAWHTEKQLVPVKEETGGAAKAGKPAKPKFEERIMREGVLFTIPHPTRTYYDISRPLSKLNQGLGPRWLGHWEAVPVGDIRSNPNYFNTDKIVMDADMFACLTDQTAYCAQHYDNLSIPTSEDCVMMTRNLAGVSAAAQSLANDRVAQIGVWASLEAETAAICHQHYKQVIPKDVGLGTYEFPVWLRFVTVGGKTVVYAEIVGSCPASVNSYNASDSFVESPSFASLAIQWQQMLTNSLTELCHVQAQGLIRIWALNTHGMKKDEIEVVENALKNPDFERLKDIVIKYDAEKLAQRSQDKSTITDRITQIRVETSQKVTEIFNGMMNTLALCERLMFFSPQELGQVSARTTSATEQKAIRDTTLGIRDYHMVGVKQMMDADKRIIHDSYMAFGSEELEVPVAERYEKSVIEKAGFEVVDDGTGQPPDGLYTIRGKKLGVFYNYTYTTRQTDDTPPDAALAQGLAQIYDVLNKDQVIAANTTLDQRLELANALFDRIAPGMFKLRVPPGVDGKQTQGGQVEQMQTQLKQLLPQIGQELQKLTTKQAEQDVKIAETDAGIQALTKATQQLAGLMERAAEEKKNGEAPTPKGQISPRSPPGVGAPPLRGVRQPISVPVLGPR